MINSNRCDFRSGSHILFYRANVFMEHCLLQFSRWQLFLSRAKHKTASLPPPLELHRRLEPRLLRRPSKKKSPMVLHLRTRSSSKSTEMSIDEQKETVLCWCACVYLSLSSSLSLFLFLFHLLLLRGSSFAVSLRVFLAAEMSSSVNTFRSNITRHNASKNCAPKPVSISNKPSSHGPGR